MTKTVKVEGLVLAIAMGLLTTVAILSLSFAISMSIVLKYRMGRAEQEAREDLADCDRYCAGMDGELFEVHGNPISGPECVCGIGADRD